MTAVHDPRVVEPTTATPLDVPSPWAAAAPAVAAALGVDPARGLDPATAAARLTGHGPNRLAEVPPRPRWLVFCDQFRNLLIGILLGAALLAFLVSGELKDPIVIGVVVLLNATLGYLQEQRAERSVAALKRMLVSTARVRRGGVLEELPAEELVPGDVVLVEAGDRIPADGRWLETADLEVDESAFTGESMPVAKTSVAVEDADAALAERRSMGFMNTTLTRGSGVLVVTETGMGTEIGKVAGMLQATGDGTTPLQRQIHDLAQRLTIVAGVAVGLVLLVGVLREVPFGENIVNAVALAVAAIPEGLPAVLTVTLAVGTHQLAKRNAIVKRLASVETLGCTTVICSDKTGTLTVNQMTARRLWRGGRTFAVTGEGYRTDGAIVPDDDQAAGDLAPVLLPFALCNESRVKDGALVGDPTEGAVLVLAAKGGVTADGALGAMPRVGVVPFDSARKLMATFHELPGTDDVLVCVKGGTDVLLERCTRVAGGDGERALDAAVGTEVQAAADAFAASGLRVLAAATRVVPRAAVHDGADLLALVEDLTLQGLAGIMDPPRPEARDAIALCRRAGIRVTMITGDHAVTAGAIARELGLEGEVLTGAELDGLDDEALAARAPGIAVVARVAPEHKVRLVRALRGAGEVVAMTGDGVNDAPALKAADIGVAMGITGTEVTKEAATMVLADDDFATIVGAVRGGRSIYENIVKFVRFQLSTNIGAIVTILTASLLSLPSGGGAFFTPIAILWVNLIMDGPPAMALGVDPPAPGIMERPPRDPRARILGARRLGVLVLFGSIMTIGTLGVYLYATGGATSGVAEPTQARAAAMAFSTFVLFQVFNIFNARFERISAFGRHALANWKLWASIGAVVVLQVLAMHWDRLQMLFTGEDVAVTLSPTDWLVLVGVASSVLVLEEIRKLVVHRGGAVR